MTLKKKSPLSKKIHQWYQRTQNNQTKIFIILVALRTDISVQNFQLKSQNLLFLWELIMSVFSIHQDKYVSLQLVQFRQKTVHPKKLLCNHLRTQCFWTLPSIVKRTMFNTIRFQVFISTRNKANRDNSFTLKRIPLLNLKWKIMSLKCRRGRKLTMMFIFRIAWSFSSLRVKNFFNMAWIKEQNCPQLRRNPLLLSNKHRQMTNPKSWNKSAKWISSASKNPQNSKKTVDHWNRVQ